MKEIIMNLAGMTTGAILAIIFINIIINKSTHRSKKMLIFKNQPLDKKNELKETIKTIKKNIKYWKKEKKLCKNQTGENFCEWMIKTEKMVLKYFVKIAKSENVIFAKR